MSINDQMASIDEQFLQDQNWEDGYMSMTLNDDEAITPIKPNSRPPPIGPGIIKAGHMYYSSHTNPYFLDASQTNASSAHHIFLVRHGLYFYTGDDSTGHLTRFGKFQARMAGHKINKIIHEFIQQLGPLTRPIKLISSTQIRAYETLYNIRLQLSNDLQFENKIVRDSGLSEVVEEVTQRHRWQYFVREYIQPIRSKKYQHSVTIIAGHGNLLTTFDHIIGDFIHKNRSRLLFMQHPLPRTTALAHGETLVYSIIGARRPQIRHKIRMDEIPVTVNHVKLRNDFYYEWATLHRCQVAHAHSEMDNIIQSGVLDIVFSKKFENKINNFQNIVHKEMRQEFDTHLLPLMQDTCRTFLYRVPYIQINTKFESFNLQKPPIPIPPTRHDQKLPFSKPIYAFTPYGMPYRIITHIQEIPRNSTIVRESVPANAVHPESRILLFMVRHDKNMHFLILYYLRLNVHTGDNKTSYLTLHGVNQVRGIMTRIIGAIRSQQKKLPSNAHLFPVNIIAEPSVEAVHSCFHARNMLMNETFSVSELMIDLGIKHNYFEKRTVSDFIEYQKMQIQYILNEYLVPDKTHVQHPSLQVHILFGDGILFTAFGQQMMLSNLVESSYRPYSTSVEPGYNILKHANALLFEAVGHNRLRQYDIITLLLSKSLPANLQIPTNKALMLPMNELRFWAQNRHQSCALDYFLVNKEKLVNAITNGTSVYITPVIDAIKKEWHPYLAGLFIYACRHYLTKLEKNSADGRQAAEATEAVNRAFNEYMTRYIHNPSSSTNLFF